MKNISEIHEALANNGNQIKPTNTCFDDALDLISKWIKSCSQTDWHSKLRLGHGICLLEDDSPYAHAWVEIDGIEVCQGGFLGTEKIAFTVDKESFYREYRVQEFTLYTLREMALENLKSGHYGPWRENYLALTRRYDKRAVK